MIVRSRWQLSTVYDGRLLAVSGSRARSGVKIEEHEEEWWSTWNVRRSARNVRRSARNVRRSARNVRRSARNVRVAREGESGEEGESVRLSAVHGGVRNMEGWRGRGAEGCEHSQMYNTWEVMWIRSSVKIVECEEGKEECK